jgi:hypothetical protein
LSNSFVIATPAAQTPFTTTFTSSFFFPVIFNEFMSHARQTIAVPCWSSWNTGISSSALSLSSISKHAGAAKSSRFIHQKVGAMFLIVLIVASIFCDSSTIGKALTQANSLKSIHFHSITGSPATHPIFPSPSTALPSDITATVFPLRVYV